MRKRRRASNAASYSRSASMVKIHTFKPALLYSLTFAGSVRGLYWMKMLLPYCFAVATLGSGPSVGTA